MISALLVLTAVLSSSSLAEKYKVNTKRYGTVKGTGASSVELGIQSREQGGRVSKGLSISLRSGEVAPSPSTTITKQQMKDLYALCEKAKAGSPGAKPFLKIGSVRSSPPLVVGTTSKGAIALQCSNPMIGVGTTTVVLGKNGYQELVTMLQEIEKKI